MYEGEGVSVCLKSDEPIPATLKGYQSECNVCVCVCSLQCIVINTDRQVLSWDCSPGERLQAFPWHPSHSYQRTDYTDFEQAYPYQGMCVVCMFMYD